MTARTAAARAVPGADKAAGWLRGSRAGLFVLALYLISSLAPVVSWLSPARYASLLYWSVGNSQITRGVSAAGYAVLLTTGLLAGTAAVVAFGRLDVR